MLALHLIDARSPQASSTTLALLADGLPTPGPVPTTPGPLGRDGIEHQVLLLGGEQLRRAAAAAGIHDPHAISVPYGRALLGYFAVQCRLPRLLRHRRPDVIHCWSVGALALAALAFPSVPRLLTLTTQPPPKTVHWLRMLVGEGTRRGPAAVILPISATIRRAVLGGGVPPTAAPVFRPSIDLSRINAARRATVRASWGLGDDEKTQAVKVVALLSDPPHAADARPAALAVSLANDSQPVDRVTNLCVLVHPDQLHRRRAQNDMRHLGRSERIVVDAGLAQPWDVLPGCDLALAMGPHAGGLSLLWAMAANVPIIAEATYANSEIVEDHHSALLAKSGQPRLLSQRILQLLDDPQLAWKLRDTARHEAYSFFSRERYRRSLRTVYDQLCSGKPVEVPPLESTGGLRFTGRA